MSRVKFAILASGSGSNAQALIDRVKSGAIPAQIACVISNKPGAKVLERAEQAGIEALLIPHKDYATRDEHDAAIVAALRERGVEFVVLAGYMRLVSPTFLAAYGGKTINLHPALLPMFPGAHAIRDALEAGVKYTGVTVHFVDEGMDTGPIIRQETVMIDPADTLETLTPKIQAVEHRLLPEVTADLVAGRLRLVDGQVVRETENGGNQE
jgi:phosphoribosylglycinamide formyltransferase-1